jgi:unspecific monooxygenase
MRQATNEGLLIRQDPRDRAFYEDPYPVYARMHARGGLAFWEDYGFWCAADHARVSALLRDRRFGRQILHVMSRDALGWPEPAAHLAPFHALERHSLLELEPPDHTRLRALVNRAFVSRAIERLRPGLEALAAERAEALAGDRPADLVETFATPIPLLTICDLVGAPREEAGDFLAWSHAMVGMYQFGVTRETEDRAAEAAAAFSDRLRRLIAARRRQPGEDLLSALIAAGDGEARLSEDELVSTVVLLLNAGHEATVHAIANGVLAVLEHGADRTAFLREADAPAAVEEVLRFDAPLHMFTRYALEDVDLGPARIRRGEVIGLLLGAANRDPAVYRDPASFRLDRQEPMHVAFGGGIHFCVGAPLARMELAIGLKALFRRWPRLKLAEPPRRRDAYHFRGVERLMATAQP